MKFTYPILAVTFAAATASGPALAEFASCNQHFAAGQPPQIVNSKLRSRTQELCFEAFAVLIRGEGLVKPWPADSPSPRYHHVYLEIDGWEYWTMGAPVPETTVINRARL